MSEATMLPDEKNGGGADPRSLARLYAVQALYQNEMTERSIADVVQDFQARDFKTGDTSDDVTGAPDVKLFVDLLASATDEKPEIDALITGALSEKRDISRLEAVLRAILRCGTGELRSNPSRSVSVVINEYVDITHAFYSGNEPGLVNGVLDGIAKAVRASRKS